MTSEYGFTLPQLFGADPADTLLLDAGFALLEARHHRKAAEAGEPPGPSYIEARIAKVRAEVRQQLLKTHRLIPNRS
jgi:hypothetical protein